MRRPRAAIVVSALTLASPLSNALSLSIRASGRSTSITMSTFRNPHGLPTKDCVVCNRPFTWRKKWESNWDEITTCSKRCNGERKKSNRIVRGAERAAEQLDGSKGDTVDAGSSASSDEDSVPVLSASVVGSAQPQPTTMAGKVAAIAVELGIDDSLPLTQVIAAANDAMRIEGEGPMANMVARLMSELSLNDDSNPAPEALDPKAARKAAKKAAKLQKRARREGEDEQVGQKACSLCERRVDLLIRCQIDSHREWNMVCGKCWKTPAVAGGVVDGDGSNKHYRYGGLCDHSPRTSGTIALPCFQPSDLPSPTSLSHRNQGAALPLSQGRICIGRRDEMSWPSVTASRCMSGMGCGAAQRHVRVDTSTRKCYLQLRSSDDEMANCLPWPI